MTTSGSDSSNSSTFNTSKTWSATTANRAECLSAIARTTTMASSSQNQTQSTNQVANGASTTNPWASQIPYLQQGFNAAGNALSAATANGGNAPSNFTAQFTPQQLAAFSQQLGYGTNNNGISTSSANAGGALNSAGAPAVASGLYGLQNYQAPTAQSVANNTAMFANNPELAGMVQAANQPLINQAAQTQGAIDQAAAGAGNQNSSRTGVEAGLTNTALMQGEQANAAQIYGGAYNSGLSAAGNLANLQQQGQLGALSGLVSGGTGAVGTGVGANTGAVNQQGGLYGIANTGIQGQQQAAQAGLTNQLQAWQFGQQSPFAAVSQYMPLIQGNYGGTTNTTGTNVGQNYGTTTNYPSTLAQIGAGLGMGSSLFPSTGPNSGILNGLFGAGNN